jgi:hypothetical protein
MKSASAAFFLLLTFSVANAQAAPKLSLELGSMKVWLGMSKADVLSACAAVGYSAIDSKNGVYITSGKGENSHIYDVEFKKGLLSYASRSWASHDKDYLEAVIGVLKGFDGATCSISNQPMNKPESALERVLVICGDRSVMLISGTIGKDRVGDVIERIGWTTASGE